jgi:hypothetical protein
MRIISGVCSRYLRTGMSGSRPGSTGCDASGSLDAFLLTYRPQPEWIKSFIECLDLPDSTCPEIQNIGGLNSEAKGRKCADVPSWLVAGRSAPKVLVHKPKSKFSVSLNANQLHSKSSVFVQGLTDFSVPGLHTSSIFEREERRRAQNRDAQRRYRERRMQSDNSNSGTKSSSQQ